MIRFTVLLAAALCARTASAQIDLVARSSELIDPASGIITRTGYLGEPARISAVVENTGAAAAGAFRIMVALSTDSNLSLLSDTIVTEVMVTGVGAGVTSSFDLAFTLPLVDRNMQPLPSGNYFLFTLADSGAQVVETSEVNNNVLVASGPVYLHAPAPDLTVTSVVAPSSAGAGEKAFLHRVIRNLGNRPATAAAYRCYLSANTFVSASDVPLVTGAVTLAPGAIDAATEVVTLPAGTTPGIWYLGCIANYDGAIADRDAANDSAVSQAMVVDATGLLRVHPWLPDAAAGQFYSWQLLASGEHLGLPSTWSLAPGSSLPPGLTLLGTGLVSGTADAMTVSTFTITVTNAMRTASAAVTLRVVPVPGAVTVDTVTLPAAVNDPARTYRASLAASGGVPPYSWRITAGALPAGLTLSTAGMLSGSLAAGTMPGTTPITVEAQDSSGAHATRELQLRVVEDVPLVIATTTLPDARAGAAYSQQLRATAVGGAMLPTAPTWTASGDVPMGLTVEPGGMLQGTPARAGLYRFSVTATAANGRSDTVSYLLRVAPGTLSITATGLPAVVKPGDAVTATLSAGAGAQFRRVAGSLPPGVTLAAGGELSGTVPNEMSEGVYDFTVEATDAAGATALGSFVVEVRVDPPSGCSAAGGLALGAPLLALFAVLRKRRRVLALGAAVLAASPVAAQSYQVVGPTTAAYVPVTNGTTVSPGTTIGLPFTFRFYGQPFASVDLSAFGYLAFAGSVAASSNLGIPHSVTLTPPSAFIAPWWDTLTTTGSTYRYAVQGTAPNRSITFEWFQVAASGNTTRFSFQVTLYESTNRIRLAYGPSAPGLASASVGIQRALGDGIAALSCTTGTGGNCTVVNFPAGQAIDVATPPNLQLASVLGDPVARAGLSYGLSATVRNTGGLPASGVIVRAYLSSDPLLDGSDVSLGDLPAVTVAGSSTAVATGTVTMPAVLSGGFVLTRVDPDGAIAETDENDNLGPPVALTVGPPLPDLAASSVTAPATAASGAAVQLGVTIANLGNAAAGSFRYTWLLSENAVVTTSDVPLGASSTVPSLAAGSMVMRSDMVTLPQLLAPGRYWLGVCVNFDPLAMPQLGLTEISLFDDCAAGQPVLVTTGAVAVATTWLPPGSLGRPYGAHLRATGGDGSYVWSVTSGTLPTGLALSAAGDLSGVPSATGTFMFQVSVASDGAMASAMLSLTVASTLPLSLPDPALPPAERGLAYAADLGATGGTPPYSFTLSPGDTLPPGLTLSVAGVLSGIPSASGSFTFRVQAADAAAGSATREVRLVVLEPPAALRVDTGALENGTVGRPYSNALAASGGRAPYSFELVELRELPLVAGDEAGAPATGSAASAALAVVGLRVDGSALIGTPLRMGFYAVTLRVTDTAGASRDATFTLSIAHPEPLGIATSALPDAVTGEAYEVQLAHEPASAAVTYRRVGMGELPGLTLSPDGRITGTPSAAATETAYSFVVHALDTAGRRDVRGYSIRLRPPAGGGCSATGLAPLALLAVLLLGRRRLLAFAAPAVLSLLLASCGGSPCNPKSCTGCCSAGVCVAGNTHDACGSRGAQCATCGAGQVCGLTACIAAPPPGTGGGMASAGGTGGTAGGTSGGGAQAGGTGTAGGSGTGGGAASCAGVVCGDRSTCDAATGLCRCNGAVCPSGTVCRCPSNQASCAEGVKFCAAPIGCGGTSCAGGTTCDPLDGVCRCGANGPACAASELCIAGPPPRCFNGTCSPACGPNLTCSPDDGTCKCGGVTCGAGEVCVSNALGLRCRQACDVRAPACTGAQSCFVDTSAAPVVTYCAAPTGMQQEDQACTSPTACYAGMPPRALHCNGLALGQTGICRAYCDVAAGTAGCLQVPRSQICQQIAGAPAGSGYCLPQ